jgi:putative polyhydroxyalkanoate system protein
MATIDITRNHSLAKDAARSQAEELAKTLESKFNLAWKWVGDVIHFEAPAGPAKGTKGEVHVGDSSIRVAVDLPFLLKAFKSTIEEKVNEKLSKMA